MLNNDSPSITLDEAEQKKIGLVQNRLTVLQAEVLKATIELSKKEEAVTMVQRNKEYYDTLIESTKPEVEALQKRSEALKAEIVASENLLQAHRTEHEAMNTHYSQKTKEHDEREEAIRASNAESVKEASRLSTFERHLEGREKKVEAVEAAFRTALDSLK